MTLPNWRGRTVACLASGPSLTAADCERVRAAGLPTIVTNTTFRCCPWADVLFAFDALWWRVHLAEVRATFAGRKFTQLTHFIARDVECARVCVCFRSLGNSGANAIALAACAGAMRIVLLGYDCQLTDGRSHHHGDHPASLRNCDTIAKWPRQFERCAAFAARMGASVINATRSTALTCFPVASLESELDAWLTIS